MCIKRRIPPEPSQSTDSESPTWNIRSSSDVSTGPFQRPPRMPSEPWTGSCETPVVLHVQNFPFTQNALPQGMLLGSLAKSLLVWVPHATLRQLSGSLLLCRNISVAGLGVKSACCPHCCKQSQLPFVVVSTRRQEHFCKLKADNLLHISKATHAWHSDLQASWACAAALVLSGCVSDLETGAVFC